MFFYLQNPLDQIISGLGSSHFIACRILEGDLLTITDLQGNLYSIKITDFNKKDKSYKFEILDRNKLPKESQNILIQARIEKLYLEKLIEILPHAKVSKLILFESENSIRQKLNLDRLEKILIRSCEQSESVYKPEIEIFEDKLVNLLKTYKPFLLDKDGQNFSAKIFSNNPDKCILVGPEGGFTANEKSAFSKSKLQSFSLGKTVYPAWLAGFSFFSRAE